MLSPSAPGPKDLRSAVLSLSLSLSLSYSLSLSARMGTYARLDAEVMIYFRPIRAINIHLRTVRFTHVS